MGYSCCDLLVPLYDNQQSLLFVQGGIRKPSDSLTGNLVSGSGFAPSGRMAEFMAATSSWTMTSQALTAGVVFKSSVAFQILVKATNSVRLNVDSSVLTGSYGYDSLWGLIIILTLNHQENSSLMLTEKSGHLAWCALAALALARQDGLACSPAQENLFLIRWLAIALKQRRFLREATPDMEWLLREGRQYGPGANLAIKLDYLWRASTGILLRKNDFLRLTYALEIAKSMHWKCRPLSEREWSGPHAVSLNSAVNGIYISQATYDGAFDDEGHLVSPLMARLTGRVAGLETLFNRCGWQLISSASEGMADLYVLTTSEAEKTDT